MKNFDQWAWRLQDRTNLRKLLSELIVDPHHNWQLQGMGMFRLYLSREWRLHVWDNRFKTPNVTMLHDHPWDFESHVLCGRITNVVYSRTNSIESYGPKVETFTHDERTIVCGPGGGLCDNSSKPIHLSIARTNDYVAGDVYGEPADWIHETVYQNGTVTLVRRTFKENTEHAHVYPAHGKPWVSAEPRIALPWEVAQVLSTTLCVLIAEQFS